MLATPPTLTPRLMSRDMIGGERRLPAMRLFSPPLRVFTPLRRRHARFAAHAAVARQPCDMSSLRRGAARRASAAEMIRASRIQAADRPGLAPPRHKNAVQRHTRYYFRDAACVI